MVKTILFWAFVIIGVITLVQFIELLESVTKYFKEKKKKVETQTLKILEKNNSSPSFNRISLMSGGLTSSKAEIAVVVTSPVRVAKMK